jgi:hypothetical protein
MDRAELREFAQEKVGNIAGLNLDRAHIAVDRDFGRVLVVPMATDPVSNIEELANGATVFGLSIDFALPRASLRDGTYTVRVSRDRGTWVARFLQEDQVVFSTVQVRVIETGQRSERPIALTFNFGLIMFLAGLGAGVVIGIVIAKVVD